MRLLSCCLFLALLFVGCSQEKRFPVMTLDSLMTLDRAQLEASFGKEALLDTLAPYGGLKIPMTVLFPGTPREVRLNFSDVSRSKIIWLDIGAENLLPMVGPESNPDTTGYWRTRDGLHLGMRMKEVESINGKPFKYEFSKGTVKSTYWNRGSLEDHAEVVFEVSNAQDRFPPTAQSENMLGSDDEEWSRINPRVVAIATRYEYLPMTFSIATVRLEKDGITFEIPRAVDTNPDQKDATEKINEEIMSNLRLTAFDEKSQSYLAADNPNFTWRTFNFWSSYNPTHVGIRYQGEYVFGGQTEFKDSYIYALTESGEFQPFDILPFQSLFSLTGYWQFMDKYWLPECHKRYEKEGCKNLDTEEGPLKIEEGCQCDDIYFGVRGKDAILTLSMIQCGGCMDQPYSVTLPMKTLVPYMSEWAKEVVSKRNFFELSPLEQSDMISTDLIYHAPNYVFIQGATANNDTLTMQLELLPEEAVNGQWMVRGKILKSGFGSRQFDVMGNYGGDSLVLDIPDEEYGRFLRFDFVTEATETSRSVSSESQLEFSVVERTLEDGYRAWDKKYRKPIKIIILKSVNADSFFSRRGTAMWR